MREFLQQAQDSLTQETTTPEVVQKTQQPVVTKPPVEQPEQTSDDKLIAIVSDFYAEFDKELTPEESQEISSYYKGDYERMLKDMYSEFGVEYTDEDLKSVQKYYKLIEDAPVSELPKEIIDFNATVDELENKVEEDKKKLLTTISNSGRFGLSNDLEKVIEGEINKSISEKDSLSTNFNFKPITLKEVVNTLGKGRDDIDEVAQTSKLYLEKYTKRMEESFERFENNLPDSLKGTIDIDSLSAGDKQLLDEYNRRMGIRNQQRELNKSTIYKKDEIKRKINNAAREAKDNDQSVRDAILRVMEEEGVMTEGGRELVNEPKESDFDTWVTTAAYNTKERVKNTLKNTWRGAKEAFDLWDEDSTVYNEAFMKEFDQYLDTEVDEDVKRLMWGTNKSKYDGDIHEKRVDVDGVKLIVNDKGEVEGVRRPDGNMAWNFKEDEVEAINKYQSNKDELKNEVYHDLRMGTLGAKGTQVATDMIPIIAATVGTGGAGGTLLGTYAVTYGDFYDQQFAKTGSVGNATAFASAATAMTSMLEGLGGIEGSIIKNASKKSISNAINDAAIEVASKNVVDGKTVTSAFMKHLGKQMLEETGIEVAQSLGESATEIGFNGETDLTLKEIEEIVLLTPFATGPISGAMSANSFKNYSIENIKLAAKKPELFNKLVDEWVGAAKTDEQREKREQEANFKKEVIGELSQSLVAVDELKIVDPQVSKDLLAKSVEIVEKKQQIEATKSDQAKNVYERDLAKLQSEAQELIQKGYETKATVAKQIEESKRERAERDARIAERAKAERVKIKAEALNDVDSTTKALGFFDYDHPAFDSIYKMLPDGATDIDDSDTAISKAYHAAKADNSNPELVSAVERLLAPKETKKKEFEEVKNDPEMVRLNIAPDNDNTKVRDHNLPTAADFEGVYDEGVDESELSNGLTLKVAPLPTEFNDQGEITTDAIVVDADGKTKAQFIVYGDTPVTGAIEVDAMVDEDIQGQGVATKAYQAIANKSGKPIIPASINRDYRGEKSSSTLSKAAALFWKKSLDNGTAEEVEVTTRDGKVIRTVAILPEGFKSTDTIKKIEDTGVEDSNVESEAFEQQDEVEVDMANGTFVLTRRNTPVTYKIVKFNTKNGEIVSVETTDPTGKKKVIRAKGVVAELVREKIIHENKLIENEITEEELLRATADSGARTFEQLSSDGTEQDSEADSREQKFREGTRKDILKQSVNYQGIQGKLLMGEDGAYYVMSKDGEMLFVEGGESTATNEELGITRGKTEVELLEDSLKVAQKEREGVRQQLYDLFWKVFNKKIPRDAEGSFVDAINSIGDLGKASVASKLMKALEQRISGPIANAIGIKNIEKAEELGRELTKLNTKLSPKNIKSLRKAARIEDAKTEAKQLKSERKLKEELARKRSEAVTEPVADAVIEPVEEVKPEPVKKEEPKKTKKESTDTIGDVVYNTYRTTGIVPDSVLQGIADHRQNGTTMSKRQREIYDNKTAEINRILAERDVEGSYPRKTAAKATDDAISMIETRHNNIGRVLKSLGYTQDKINSTIAVFDQVAKRWAKRNNRSVEDFYTDVFKGIEVADLGEGRRGKTVPIDGGYMVQLSTDAKLDSVVHELAHIFENFLETADKQAVLTWTGQDKWNRDTSEMFAKGFVKWLRDSDEVPNLDAFTRFKEWLMDIYDGIIMHSGQALPTFTPDLKALYKSILDQNIAPHTEKAYAEAIGKNNTMMDRMRKEGIQFKKAVFDDVLRKIETHATGFARFDYRPRKMVQLAKQAVLNEFTDPINAKSYAVKQLSIMESEPDYLPSVSAEQAIGYGYALTQMEAAYERVVAKRKKSPKNQDLLQLQDELSRDIQDLAQVLTLARSNAGLQLRIGSHSFTHNLYSFDVLKHQAEQRLKRKMEAGELADIREFSEQTQAAMEKFKNAADKLDDATREQLRAMAEQLVSEQFKNSPFMKEALKVSKAKTPRQRSADIKTKFDKINKMILDKPDMLLEERPTGLYDEDTDDTKFFKEVRSFISLLIAENEDIDSFEKLATAMEEYWPTLNQDKLLSVIVWTDPAYQKARAEGLVSTASIIKKESNLLDELRTYLTETYKSVEESGNKKIYPERLQKLEKLITEIQTLASTDYTIDTETWNSAIVHLDALQSLYADLTLEKVTFESPTLKDMVDKVRAYETARKLDQRGKQLKELEGIIEQLNNGTYEGSLSDIIPEKLDKHTDERLETIANKIGINKEVIKTFKDKANKLEIIKKIGSIAQRMDKGMDIRDFESVYEAVKKELPAVTKREVHDAILYKADPKKIDDTLKSARTNMNNEVKALEKLENFLKKNDPALKPIDNRNTLQVELRSLVDNVGKLARVRYELLPGKQFSDLQKNLEDVVKAYKGVLSGDVTTMDLKQLIDKVREIKDAETNINLGQQFNTARRKLQITELELNSKDNIFELVPELLAKYISEENAKTKKKLADEVKHERLTRVSKMFDVVKGLITSNTLSGDELKAIRKFLEVEKKSNDVKPELIKLNREVYLKRNAFNDWLESKHTNEGTSKFKLFLNTPRMLTLSADISFVMYQGGVMLYQHPIIAAKAFGQMALSAFSPNKWNQQLADMKLNPFYTIAIASGLKLVDETSLTLEEELQLTSILERFWLTRPVARMVRKFGERVYSTYMNNLRLNTFIEGLKALESVNGGFIGDDAFYGSEAFLQGHRDVVRKIADDINMHTGSSNVFTGNEWSDAKINGTLDGLSGLFIAPRLYASVFRSTFAMTAGLGVDAYKAISTRGATKDTPMKAFYQYRFRQNLQRLLGMAGWHITMLAIFANLAGAMFDDDDEEMENLQQTVLNPYSSEFLKVKSGQRIFSISPFVSYYRYAARLGFQAFINDGVAEDTFEMTPTMEKKTGFVDHTYDFFRYRWNPIVGGVIDAGIYNRDWNNQPISKYSLFSEDVGWALIDRTLAVTKRSIVPIWGQGILDNVQRKTYNQIAPEFLIDFTGINAYTVEPYQDTEVRKYLEGKKFKLSYTRVKIPKSIDRTDDIKAAVKMEFGEWLQSEIANGKKPSRERMQGKNDQIMRMKIKEARQ